MTNYDDILPSSLRNDENYIALNRLLDKAARIDLTKELIYWLDSVDASALPHLAKQFHVLGLEGWDYAATVSAKRALLKKAVELHRFKGTPWAVREGIKLIDPSLDIEEWFEYGGEPYYFRLINGTAMSLAAAVKLFWTIESLKSFRSKLDGGIVAKEETTEALNFASKVYSYVTRLMDTRTLSNSTDVIFLNGRTQTDVTNQPVVYSPYISAKAIKITAVTQLEVCL